MTFNKISAVLFPKHKINSAWQKSEDDKIFRVQRFFHHKDGKHTEYNEGYNFLEYFQQDTGILSILILLRSLLVYQSQLAYPAFFS